MVPESMSEPDNYKVYLVTKKKYTVVRPDWKLGHTIDIEDVNDIQFIKREYDSDHKSSLDYLKGV
jgi:hypothetical protein